MKTVLFFIFGFIFSVSVSAQVFYPLLPKYYQPLDSAALAKNDKKDEQPKKETLMKYHEKFSYSVTVGTAFTSFGNNMSMMNSYIAPTVNYQVNSKLNFTVNGLIMQNNLNGFENSIGATPNGYNSSPTNYGISGTAYYQLNDKWSVWGDGMYLENQSVFDNYHTSVYNNDFKTVSIGVGYKLNDKVSFNIQYRYADGLNPAFNNASPFNNPVYSPYRSNYGFWGY